LDDKELIRAAWRDCKSRNFAKFAEEIGMSRSKAWHIVHGDREKPDSPDSRKYSESGDEANLSFDCKHRVKTLEDALKYADVDTSVWRVKSWEVTSYETGMKVAKYDPQGRKLSETPKTTHLWRVKLSLERRNPKAFDDAADAVFRRMASHSPAYPKIPRASKKSPCLLEIDLSDVHFGKLAWAPETGQDYDLKIAEKLWFRAVEDLIDAAKGREIEEILLPLGNDLLHIDGITPATTSGTPQDADGRYHKIVEVSEMAAIRAVERLRQIAPVKALHVPGNHDRTASWHLCRTLWAWFSNADDVEVDCSPTMRKYHRYGSTLIGLTHGNEEKPASLPVIMATEVPSLWAETRHREWHLGHYHQPKKIDWMGTETQNGVVVRYLRSLSANDSWHARRGYLSTNRAAEAFLWDKNLGFSANYIAHAV
jgi:hypothetical protein